MGVGQRQLGRGFDGALLGQVTRLPTVIAVQLRGLAAVHSDVADLPAPADTRWLDWFTCN